MASVGDHEPITVIEVERPLSQAEAERIRDQFAENADDRPVVVHGPGMRIYEVEIAVSTHKIALAALVMSNIAFVAVVIALVLELAR